MSEPFIVTGQLHDETLLKTIEQAGFQAVHLPLIETRPLTLSKIEIARITACDWLLFTSQTAVHAFFDQLETPFTGKFAVVGSKTEKALQSHGYEASFKPSVYSADVFVEEWNASQPNDCRVGFVKGNLAKPTIEQGLHSNVDFVVVYETTSVPQNVLTINDWIAQHHQVTLVFASPSAVRSYTQAGGSITDKVIFCAIGHITKKALEDAGMTVHVMPERYTLEDVVNARLHYKE